MKQRDYSIRRSLACRGGFAGSSVTAVVTWPDGGLDWESLPAVTRNQIREHLDAAVDLVDRWALSVP